MGGIEEAAGGQAAMTLDHVGGLVSSQGSLEVPEGGRKESERQEKAQGQPVSWQREKGP